MIRSTLSRRARNSASVMSGRRRPASRPSRRRCFLASSRVDPRTPDASAPPPDRRGSRTRTTVFGGSSGAGSVTAAAGAAAATAAATARRAVRGVVLVALVLGLVVGPGLGVAGRGRGLVARLLVAGVVVALVVRVGTPGAAAPPTAPAAAAPAASAVAGGLVVLVRLVGVVGLLAGLLAGLFVRLLVCLLGEVPGHRGLGDGKHYGVELVERGGLLDGLGLGRGSGVDRVRAAARGPGRGPAPRAGDRDGVRRLEHGHRDAAGDGAGRCGVGGRLGRRLDP